MRYITLLSILLVFGCAKSEADPKAGSRQNGGVGTSVQAPLAATTVQVKPGPKVQEELLTALIKAKPGTTIELAEGKYKFTGSLSLTVPHVTLRGAGLDKTILSFAKQDQGKEGLLVTANDFRAEGFTIEDSKADGLKVVGCKNLVLKQIKARWSGEPKEANGGYGLYPVQCTNVLIEGCEAECAWMLESMSANRPM
jgi:hypothetical protein